jgi:hypothetical protein
MQEGTPVTLPLAHVLVLSNEEGKHLRSHLAFSAQRGETAQAYGLRESLGDESLAKLSKYL